MKFNLYSKTFGNKCTLWALNPSTSCFVVVVVALLLHRESRGGIWPKRPLGLLFHLADSELLYVQVGLGMDLSPNGNGPLSFGVKFDKFMFCMIFSFVLKLFANKNMN